MLTMGHPARDLWYFLQISTDPGFRSRHLETVLEEYYAVFSSYLEASGVRVEFRTFREECEKWRAPISLLWGNFSMFGILNPEPHRHGDMEKMLGGEAKDTDHPMMKEIRRRITEGVLELDALGLFD